MAVTVVAATDAVALVMSTTEKQAKAAAERAAAATAVAELEVAATAVVRSAAETWVAEIEVVAREAAMVAPVAAWLVSSSTRLVTSASEVGVHSSYGPTTEGR